MCDKAATGGEHVPPLCLFPERKDLPRGAELRKQLITVPACDEHNSSKSKDDEYLFYLLAINFSANITAKRQFFTKIYRAIHRNSSLIKRVMAAPRPVLAVDGVTGNAINTTSIGVDDSRLNSALDHISRALYFHHFKMKWVGEIDIHPDFRLRTTPSNRGQKSDQSSAQLTAMLDNRFEKLPFWGENPDVFKYQVLDGDENIHKLMRLHFYDGCRVSIFFGLNRELGATTRTAS